MSDISQPPGSESLPSWRTILVAAALFLPLLALVVYVSRHAPPATPAEPPERSALALDLARPDALIESASLSQLPRDLLKIPLLRDVLSEDFVFYYETNADRLGLVGSVRRIAYEHELTLRDSLINELLEQPAEVALWRGKDGKLAHILLRLQRGALAKALQPLAQAATSDSQLQRVGELKVVDAAAPVYRLRYNYDRAILLVPFGDELLVLSSAEMLQTSEAADSLFGRVEVAALERLLGGHRPFAPRFGLGKRDATHRLTLSADYLAFGYGKFVPQLAGLRLEMDAAGWHSFVALKGEGGGREFEFGPLWQAMPMGASFCAAVPVSSEAMKPLLARLSDQDALSQELAARLSGPVALCWYGKSRLHTPLLVTRLGGAATSDVDAGLGEVFGQMIGTLEPDANEERYPVERTSSESATTWQRNVSSSFGLHPGSELPPPAAKTDKPTGPSHFFRVSLARHGDTLLFSLDDTLVAQALATLDKRFPPLAEQLPKDVQVPAYIAPAALAALLEQETLSSLPAEVEAVFRNAAESSLLPKLRAMGTHHAYAVGFPKRPTDTQLTTGDWRWMPLSWTPL